MIDFFIFFYFMSEDIVIFSEIWGFSRIPRNPNIDPGIRVENPRDWDLFSWDEISHPIPTSALIL